MALEKILKAYLVTFWQEEAKIAVNYSRIDAAFDAEKADADPIGITWNLEDITMLYVENPLEVIKGNAKEFHEIAAPRLKKSGLLVPEQGRVKYYFIQINNLSERGDAANTIAKRMVTQYLDKISKLH